MLARLREKRKLKLVIKNGGSIKGRRLYINLYIKIRETNLF